MIYADSEGSNQSAHRFSLIMAHCSLIRYYRIFRRIGESISVCLAKLAGLKFYCSCSHKKHGTVGSAAYSYSEGQLDFTSVQIDQDRHRLLTES